MDAGPAAVFVSRRERMGVVFQNKKGRREPAAFAFRVQAGYSAACFRGGSSAPESWISAT
jgi:hypothetical protein